MKNILIVCYGMRTAGVETLVLRLSRWYCNNGFKVNVLLIKEKGDLLHELKCVATVKQFDVDNIFNFPLHNNRIKTDPFFRNIDEVFSVFPAGNWIAAQISIILNIPLKIGIYHPLDYENTNSKFEKELFNQLPDGCKLFMNEECLKSTEQIFDRQFNSVIWPLPVIDLTNVKYPRNPQRNRIVSIGRFDVFKTYNLSVIRIINELNREGIVLNYDIYGYGELENEMINLIEHSGLTSSVKIKGELDYKDFANVMSTAYIFIGCGTAVIEASYYGVPSIVATERSLTDESNGLFHKISGFNVGENIQGYRTTSIKEHIRYIVNLSDSKYNDLCQKHVQVAIEKYEVNRVCEQFTTIRGETIPSLKLLNRLIRRSAWAYKKRKIFVFLKNSTKIVLNWLGYHKYQVNYSYFNRK